METRKDLVRVEGNFIETFPAHFERAHGRPFTMAETIRVGAGEITVKHNSRYFNSMDLDVLISILKLCNDTGDNKIKAVPDDIRKIMRLKQSGKNTALIQNSLIELGTSPLVYRDCWYDHRTRKYKTSGFFTFIQAHFVQEAYREKGKSDYKEIRRLSFISLAEIVYENIKSGYFKFIDTDTYFSLPIGITRMAYLYFEKRIGKKSFYEEDVDSALQKILKRDTTNQDRWNFKERVIPNLEAVFTFDLQRFSDGFIKIIHRNKQREFFPRPHRPTLSEHGKFVLDRACDFCGRDDGYFKNVVRKYIFLLGSDLVDGMIGECRDYKPENKDRYFIHLLKSYGKGILPS